MRFPRGTGGLTVTDVTPENTVKIKAVALILLMWHHLYGVNFDESALSPVESIGTAIAVSAKICLGIFLFCSGYGLYRSYISKEKPGKNYVFTKIIQTLVPYWIIMIPAVVTLICLRRFDPRYIPVNLFALIHDDDILYVSFSWYIKLYVLLLLLLPLIRLIERRGKKNPVLDILIYTVLPFMVSFLCKDYMDEEHFISIPRSVISTVLFVVFWFPLFASGMIFAKYGIYKKIRTFTDRFPAPLVVLAALLLCGYVLYMRLVFYWYCIADVVYAPLFITGCLLIMDNVRLKSKYVLPYLGRKSIYYWLLSGMFFLNTAELSVLIKWPKIPVLVLIWTMLLLTPFVYVTDLVSGKILRRADNAKRDPS